MKIVATVASPTWARRGLKHVTAHAANRFDGNSSLALALVLLTLRGVQHELKSPKSVAKLFLGGLLAVLLLAFGGVAAVGSLHHASHHDHASEAGACLICSLAQGQVDLPDQPCVAAAIALIPLCGLLAASSGAPWSLPFVLPPGRAPPRFSRSL